jgi:hypothetical protein
MSEQRHELTNARAVERILALEEEEALENALAAADPLVAAQAVGAAPTLEQKTTLLWAMDDRQRREALEMVPPALIGAMVQNLEEDNRYLLGDLSFEQFRALLRLCSSERKFYWISTALSFTDARANALPLLLTTGELVEILGTRPDFDDHLRALADYPLEDARLPAELMQDPAQTLIDLFGANNLLRNFPVADAQLEQVLQTLLDFDPDRYVDLIREGLRSSDYVENHPLEWDTLTEDPVLLRAAAAVEPVEIEEEIEQEPAEGAEPFEAPLALVPVGAPPLARLAAALPPALHARVSEELQHLYIRQAVAEGGSFLRADLERAARRVEAYLLLGLQAESGGESRREAAVIARRPLHKISLSGAKVVENLRQVALRMGPLEKLLTPRHRAVVRSLSHPQLTVGADGGPRIVLAPERGLPAETDLQEARAWVSVAAALGYAKTESALKAAGSVDRLQEALALGAVLFGRLDLGLVEPGDEARFRERYLTPSGHVIPEAQSSLRRAAEAGPADSELTLPLLEAALARLAARLSGLPEPAASAHRSSA